MRNLHNDPLPSASASPGGRVLAVAIGQVFSWGGIYYAFAAMSGELQREFGWPVAAINGAMTASLVATALVSYPVGRLLHQGRGRWVMSGGSLLAGLLLMAWARTDSLPGLYLVWIALGVCMAAVLYDAAFSVTVQLCGRSYAKGLAMVTFCGGFASTVFFPLVHEGIQNLGWRPTAFCLGIIQIMISAPLYGWSLRGLDKSVLQSQPVIRPKPLTRWSAKLKTFCADRRIWGMSVWFVSHSMAFSGLIFQVFPLITHWNIAPATAVSALALIGPMQVAGRVFMVSLCLQASHRRMGLTLMAGLALSSLLLMLTPQYPSALFAFAMLYGFCNGMMTLLRGTAVGAVFGISRYAEINGSLATLSMFAAALSPLALAALWTLTGNPFIPLAAVAVLACLGTTGVYFATAARVF